MIAVLRATGLERLLEREHIRRPSETRRRQRRSRRGDNHSRHDVFGTRSKRHETEAKRWVCPFEAPPVVLRADVIVTIRHTLELLAARRALEAMPIAQDRPNPVHLLPVLSASELQRELHESVLAALLPSSDVSLASGQHGARARLVRKARGARGATGHLRRRRRKCPEVGLGFLDFTLPTRTRNVRTRNPKPTSGHLGRRRLRGDQK